MKDSARPLRSALYVPASNARALAKAQNLDVDAVIVDLEDAVAPDAKEQARRAARAALAEGFGGAAKVLRVNAIDHPGFADDMACAADADAVLLPKVERVAALQAAREVLPSGTALWAMIETPRGVLDALALADALAAISAKGALVIGPNDLAKETRIGGRAALMPLIVQIVAAARAAGLGVLDGVFNDFRDTEGFQAECAEGRRMGCDGKTLIHPAQIAPCNAAFSPSDEAVARARRIVAAFEGRLEGVIQMDGEMVERLHLAQAEALLRRADRR